ncbi:MAG: hypothetical protein GXY88_06525 [Tissierellia bacterium]|nr:hypothetical protein [Tissierellia bacterium]
MKQSFVIIYGALAILLIIAYFVGGGSIILEGINKSKGIATSSFFMLLASFIIIGQLNVLLTADLIEKWLQVFSGIKAIIVSAIAGGLFPGGPYIYYPFVMSFKDKNLPIYIMISFLFGKHIYDLSRLPMEVGFVGLETAIIRFLITLPIPIIVGLLVQRYPNIITFVSDLKAGERDGRDHHNS